LQRTAITLRSFVISFTWLWAAVFVPIETYLSFSGEPYPLPGYGVLSGYVVNVLGVGLTLWGAVSLRRGRSYAEGVLAAGWGWTTAVFWRATNLRYWYAAEYGELEFGSKELWLAPLLTALVATVFLGSLILLVRRQRAAEKEVQ
jgi:hypothetical protein